MSKLQPDFIELQAYVDGEVDDNRAHEIAGLISVNPQLAAQISAIRELKKNVASAINSLPLSDSVQFGALTPQQPDSGSLLKTAEDPDTGNLETEKPNSARSGNAGAPISNKITEIKSPTIDPPGLADKTPPGPDVWTRGIKATGLAIAAGFAGALFGLTLSTSRQSPIEKQSWITQVASYHDMYTSATLERVANSIPSQLKDRQTYESAIGEKLIVPDLSSLGFQFKRAQLLQSGKKPVVQLAYLGGDHATPLALCITPAESGNREMQGGKSHGVNYVNWSSSTLDYLIVSKLPSERLQQIAMLSHTSL